MRPEVNPWLFGTIPRGLLFRVIIREVSQRQRGSGQRGQPRHDVAGRRLFFTDQVLKHMGQLCKPDPQATWRILGEVANGAATVRDKYRAWIGMA